MMNTKMLWAAILVAAVGSYALKRGQDAREIELKEARAENHELRLRVQELDEKLTLLEARAEMAFQRQSATESIILTRRQMLELESILDTATEEDAVEGDAR